ncbi:MAG: T9SS type A sorting domain-containing protein [Aequorivita sp.]|nr:T9SS type A sorting domain-containing protein [Aequorivita sp.]
MKSYIIFFFTIFTCSLSFAQEVIPDTLKTYNNSVYNVFTNVVEPVISLKEQLVNSHNPAAFDFNCNENFWSVNNMGVIQQWSLINGTIYGGDTVLTGGGKGLALCGELGSETFYCANYPLEEITYYQEQIGWITVPTPNSYTNNGGYENSQYYMGVIFDPGSGFMVNRILYYFDGTTFETIEILETDYFTVADIAVDGLGRAWVFKGNESSTVNSLQVYDNSGLIVSFDIGFDSSHTYGSFFLNDTLFVGMGDTGINPNSITPIIINGQFAELGTPISMPPGFYNDLASCQDAQPLSINNFEMLKYEMEVFPNPTSDILHFSKNIDFISVEIINLEGKLVRTFIENSPINLAGLPNGIYILKIITVHGIVNKKVVKK